MDMDNRVSMMDKRYCGVLVVCEFVSYNYAGADPEGERERG